MQPFTFYEFAIDKVAKHIKSPENQAAVRASSGDAMTAFLASDVLAVVFDKPKEVIVMDIVNAKDA